jgi:hypothetical protein
VEGTALAAEERMALDLIDSIMSADPLRPLYKLRSGLTFTALQATTDMTLSLYLRPSCNAAEPDSIAFAEAIGASWGLPMASLNQRSKRAHNGTQYLSYEYGKIDAFRVYDYIQAQLPATARKVEPYLLQACNIQSARADAATVALVKACLGI